jgi:hypothetical protein
MMQGVALRRSCRHWSGRGVGEVRASGRAAVRASVQCATDCTHWCAAHCAKGKFVQRAFGDGSVYACGFVHAVSTGHPFGNFLSAFFKAGKPSGGSNAAREW